MRVVFCHKWLLTVLYSTETAADAVDHTAHTFINTEKQKTNRLDDWRESHMPLCCGSHSPSPCLQVSVRQQVFNV